MATVEECRAALLRFAAGLSGADGTAGGLAAMDRSVTCRINDLGVTFAGRLTNGTIEDLAVARPPVAKAQIRLAMTSDDLLALVAGELDFARAWATGRVRLEAGVRDLLRLRSLL